MTRTGSQPAERRVARATARRALAGVHVSETSLAALVPELRKALGDTFDDRRVIRTLHCVGYAFIGDALVAGQMPVTVAPVCRLIWRRKANEVPAG